MKDKLFLLIILLLSLAIGLMMPIVEGACSSSSYISGGTGSDGKGSKGAPVKYRDQSEKEQACKVVTDSENSVRLGDVTGLISKLGSKVNNSYDSSNKLLKRSEQLQKNSQSLNNLANDKDVDSSDACKQYPEAC
tara:strand:+ start:28 stop:432 length:405 start_codon:yes stop_codon:yes gene_type:complete